MLNFYYLYCLLDREQFIPICLAIFIIYLSHNCLTEPKDIEIDFGVIDENGNINGLIGLDVLLELGVSIDLKNLKLKL